jgi:peptidoglycan/LPS O-acetylase OafA/YrhL
VTSRPSPLRPSDPPALHRLSQLDVDTEARRRHPTGRVPVTRHRHTTGPIEVQRHRRRVDRRFGHQPGLDGLRGLSVIAVICYHAGFGWMRGGWIGVEVFFVVSGFLITTLLLEERTSHGRVSVPRFWMRRARRLLPALAVVLVVVGVWALIAGSDQQLSQLRRDYPWAVFYAGNWGQIVGGVPYYATDPPLLRHLWSLGIEEQFYLVWPLVFVAIAGSRLRRVQRARLVGALALVPVIVMFWLHVAGPGPIGDFDRINFLYLSTFTRAGGLLAGAAAAFVWRPWTSSSAGRGNWRRRVLLDSAGAVAVSALVCMAVVGELTAGYVYEWLLPLVSLCALATVMVVVHPAAVGMRAMFGWRPLAAVGERSYGLYLWHWPIFVFLGVRHGSPARFVLALAITAICSELCYRYVERPARRGALGVWWRTAGPARVRVLAATGVAIAVLVGLIAAVRPYDRAAGGEATFEPPAVTRPATPVSKPTHGTRAVAPTTTAPVALPRRVAIVGDSQAHSLAANVPAGLDATLSITDGSVVGCSVYDSGTIHSSRDGFATSFTMCDGWQDEWADAVRESDADIALVVLGAWDVFDLETVDGEVLTFGTPEWDAHFRAGLQEGIDAVTGAGAKAALLEVPCMRPQDVEGAGVPALPERGDDTRVAHVNQVLRAVVAANARTTTFVEGPDEWCDDEAVANDLNLRWDGVHVYQPGAALIYETIAPALVAF